MLEPNTVNIEKLKADLRAAIQTTYEHDTRWLTIMLLTELLIAQEPKKVIAALCDGEVTLEKITSYIHPALFHDFIKEIQMWQDSRIPGMDFIELSSNPRSHTELYQRAYLPRMLLLASLEKHGIVKIERFKENGWRRTHISIVNGKKIYSEEEIKEHVYLGQELKFTLFEDPEIRRGTVINWDDIHRILVKDASTSLVHKVPYYVLETESLFSEAALQARVAFNRQRHMRHYGSVQTLQFLHDTRYAVSTAGDGLSRLWDLDTGACQRIVGEDAMGRFAAAIDGQDRYLLVLTYDATCKLWDLQSGKLLQSIKIDIHRDTNVDITADGKYILKNLGRNEVQLWDAATATCLHVFRKEKRYFRWAYFDSDDSRIIAFSDRKLYIWPIADCANARIIDLHDQDLSRIIRIQDNKIYFQTSDSATKTYTLKAWDLDNETLHTRFSCSPGDTSTYVTMMSISGSHVVLSASDGTHCEVWDMDKQVRLHTLTGHTGKILCAAFSRDGFQLLTGSADSSMRLWDVASGECLKVL